MPAITKIFEKGEVLENSGVEIVRCIGIGSTQEKIMYKVRLLCHDEFDTLSHRSILRKAYRGATKCRKCAAKGRRFTVHGKSKNYTKVYGKTDLQWPVTPSVMANARSSK